ncbi:MAG: hypothetical protein WCY24_04590 [Lutispora sp.]|nr:hypothetical protein [Bacteroidales bacterium]MDD4834629.1 hypothetical protein [Lutispora sp.]
MYKVGMLSIDKKNILNLWYDLKKTFHKNTNEYIEKKLIEEFGEIQSSIIKNKPILGASQWYLCEILFLEKNVFAIQMEDGHIENYAIIKYNQEKDCFNLVEEIKIDEGSEE